MIGVPVQMGIGSHENFYRFDCDAEALFGPSVK